MKISVIDIGSNSVRLMLWVDGYTLYKKIQTTRLGEGLSLTGIINPKAIERSVDCVCKFFEIAKKENSDKIFAFATAAVRRAKNGFEFVQAVKNACGLDIEVVSGDIEAKMGFLGALGTNKGAIIDIGGASTEITVGKNGKIDFAKSIDIGTVRLKDLCEEDKEKLKAVISDKIFEFGNISLSNVYAIGGTATTLVSLSKKLKEYDPNIVHGSKLTKGEVFALSEKLLSSTQEERLNMDGMEKGRADVIGGGALLLAMIMDKFNLQFITVSEKDNLEGFLVYKKERGEL